MPSSEPKPPSLLAALAAPWLGIVAPARAAALLARVSLPLLLLVELLATSAGSAGLVFCALWANAVEWREPSSVSLPDGTIEQRPAGAVAIPIHTVWQRWHADSPIGPAEIIFISVTIGAFGLGLFGAWVSWPLAHVAGSPTDSLRRAYAAAVAASGVYALALVLIAAYISAVIRSMSLGAQFNQILMIGQAVLVLAGSLVLALWLTWTSRGARGPAPDPPPPRCEGCGYDLTHQPESGRCSECGFDVARSLTAGGMRPGSAWQDASLDVPTRWWRTVFAVLFTPRAFYQRLCARADEPKAWRFAGLNFALLALLVPPWLLLALVWGEDQHPSAIRAWSEIVLPATLGVLCGAWCVHRIPAAIAGMAWIPRGVLHDGRWGAHVIAYESAIIWLYAAFNGMLVTSFIVGNMWISELAGGERWAVRKFGAPLEVILMMGGNALLPIYSLLRYRDAIRAVRWNNF